MFIFALSVPSFIFRYLLVCLYIYKVRTKVLSFYNEIIKLKFFEPQGGMKQNSDDLNIEREARERVAAMLHRSLGASTEHDYSQASMTTESFDGNSY